MKHYVGTIPQNRTQCIEVLQKITTYSLFPETPSEITKRMSLRELQEYTEETKGTISRNLSKKANNPKKNSKGNKCIDGGKSAQRTRKNAELILSHNC